VSLMVFLTLAIPFVVGLPLVAEDALVLLGNAQIAERAGWTTFLIAAGVTTWGAALIQAQVFYGARRTGTWGAITISATALNLALNLILVPWVGVPGAAAATFASYGVLAVAAAIIGGSILRIRYDVGHLVACAVAAAAMAIPLVFVQAARPAALVALITGSAALYGLVLLAARAAVPALRGSTIDQLRSITKTH
jgi:O-antigen/teichoic acid export membrane protein